MKHLRSLAALAFGFAILQSCGGNGTTGSAELDEPLPLDSLVKIGTLENGLTYYIRQNQKPEKRAELRLVVNAGSIQEDDDQQGLAHFCEHMLFNGSENFAKNEMIDFFELTGMKFGPHVNAYTSFDETVYMIRARTDSAEVWEQSWQVLEDWAHLASFDSLEIEKERGVVLEEWRLRLGPDERMRREYWPTLFKDSRYAERLPIGLDSIIRNFDHEAVKRFYHDWYRPDLMAVVAVGDFDVAEVEEKIKAHFSGLENPETARTRDSYDVPDQDGVLASVATDQEAAFTEVNIFYKHDRQHINTVRDYRWDLMTDLYNSMVDARLEELKQQEDPPFVFAGSAYYGQVRTKDAYSSYAYVDEGAVRRGLETLITENQRVLQHGFTETELERAKEDMLQRLETRFNDRDKQNSRSFAGLYVYNFLSNRPMPGIEYNFHKAGELLPGIKLDEVNQLAKDWIGEENVVIVVTGPEKDGLVYPSKEELIAWFDAGQEMEVEPYVDEGAGLELMAEKPSGGTIANEVHHPDIDVTELTLSNGARVILKPTDFKNDEIMFAASSFGGTSLYPDEDYQSALYSSSVAMESGLGEMDHTQLQKFLQGKVINLWTYVDDLYEGIQGRTTPKDLETMLQMVYLHFAPPRKDETAFKAFQTREKMLFKNLLEDPDYYFMSEVAKLETNNHLRGRIFPEEGDLDQINHDRALQIYDERFDDAGDFTFLFVGSFDVESIKPLVQTYIGAIPDLPREELWKDVGMTHPAGDVSHQLNRGTEPKSSVSIKYFSPFDWTGENRLLATLVCDLVRIKLREALREDKGGVYGVGCSPEPQRWPKPELTISIGFGCAPENVEDLIATALAEIEKVKTDGPQEKDIQKVKETAIRSRETDMKENRFWLNALDNYYYYNEDPNTVLQFESKVKAVTAAQLKAAANAWFTNHNLLRVVMYPEAES